MATSRRRGRASGVGREEERLGEELGLEVGLEGLGLRGDGVFMGGILPQNGHARQVKWVLP